MNRPLPTKSQRGRHMITGVAFLSLGVSGLAAFWEIFAEVSRGFFPMMLIGGGLIMVMAGQRELRTVSTVTGFRFASSGVVLLFFALAVSLLLAVAFDFTAGVNAWSPKVIFGYIFLGLASGIVGGMLGLGGGLIHLSGLTLIFGVPFAYARGATLMNNVFVNAAAAARYGKQRLMRVRDLLVLIPSAIVGVTFGALLQEQFNEKLMHQILSVFVLFLIGAIILDSFWTRTLNARRHSEAVRFAHGLTGSLAGILSGVLGISGGVIAVPGQTLLGAVPLRNAIANSTALTAVSSALASMLVFVSGVGTPLSGAEMFTIAALFLPGNVVGGHIGAVWMEKLPVPVVRLFFVIALIGLAIRSWSVL